MTHGDSTEAVHESRRVGVPWADTEDALGQRDTAASSGQSMVDEASSEGDAQHGDAMSQDIHFEVADARHTVLSRALVPIS